MSSPTSSSSSIVSQVIEDLQSSLLQPQLHNNDNDDDDNENNRINNVIQSLFQWNEDMEQNSFYSSFISSSSSMSEEEGDLIRENVLSLHSLLLFQLSRHLHLFMTVTRRKEGVITLPKSSAYDAGSTLQEWEKMTMKLIKEKSNDDADLMAAQLANNILHTFSKEGKPIEQQQQQEDEKNLIVEKLDAVSEILKTLTYLIRFVGSMMQQQPPQQLQKKNKKEDPLKRLLCQGNVRLYLALLESSTSFSSSTTSTSTLPFLHAKNNVARNASTLLFRTAHYQPQPLLQYFWLKCFGYKLISKLLIQSNVSAPLLFSVVRHVHYVIASLPKSFGVEKLNQGLQEHIREQGEEKVDVSGGYRMVVDLSTVLVATLAWCIRSTTPTEFPGVDCANDRRADIALEILRILFAMGGSSSSANTTPNQTEHENMTQMGILLCDIFHLPNGNVRNYEIKLAALNLLIDAPTNYGYYLLANDGVRAICEVLKYQVGFVVLERDLSASKSSTFLTGGNNMMSMGKEDAAAITPLLMILIKYCSANPMIMKIVKERIFPPEECEEIYTKARREVSTTATMYRKGGGGAKNMSPVDNPSKTTLRYKLIKLMTWPDSNVKRLSSELLWILCSSDPTEFVLRTGFGNAVHMLGIKGLVNIPKESTTVSGAGVM